MLGEAPGRLGAGRTSVPFSGDESGRRFEKLLAAAGLRRADVFVSNALLCLPLDAAGRNRRPSAPELANCATHLEATLAAVRPRLVVTLGATALAALDRIEAAPPHPRHRRRDAATRGAAQRYSRSTTPAARPNSTAPGPSNSATGARSPR